jgi:hypothetical protein
MAAPAEPSEPELKPEPSKGPFLGLAIGLAIVLAVVAYLLVESRSSSTRGIVTPKITQGGEADPYAKNLAFTDVHLSAAENFAGGTSYYVEGKITNSGPKIVNGATVEVTFKNSLGQVVQRETQTVMAIIDREPAIDVAALNQAPLKAGQSREFRLTFERISADWNQQVPELRIVTVFTK